MKFEPVPWSEHGKVRQVRDIETVTAAPVYLAVVFSLPSPGCCYVDFPVRNWVLAITLRVIVNISFSVTMPSMHQFITTPTAEQLRSAGERNSSTTDGDYAVS